MHVTKLPRVYELVTSLHSILPSKPSCLCIWDIIKVHLGLYATKLPHFIELVTSLECIWAGRLPRSSCPRSCDIIRVLQISLMFVLFVVIVVIIVNSLSSIWTLEVFNFLLQDLH